MIGCLSLVTPKWRFPTVCMVGLVIGLENVYMHTYIYRQTGLF